METKQVGPQQVSADACAAPTLVSGECDDARPPVGTGQTLGDNSSGNNIQAVKPPAPWSEFPPWVQVDLPPRQSWGTINQEREQQPAGSRPPGETCAICEDAEVDTRSAGALAPALPPSLPPTLCARKGSCNGAWGGITS